MLTAGDTVLVGVSGGPDSVFLLHLLNSYKRKFGIKLFVAHMDHGLRGAESAKDAKFVKMLSRKLGLKLAYKKINVKSIKTKLSLEELLREKRYAFFKTAAKKFKANIVTTAHTLDDQAETVMMRIIKGASLKGIVGIHPVRTEGKVRYVRPLLEVEKKEIVSYLKSHAVAYRIDRTNFKDDFLRNRVRNKVLPYLEKINPRLKRALSNLSESLREDFDFIEEEKRKRKGLIKKNGQSISILISDIVYQPKALQKEIVREAIKIAGGNIKKLTFRHWKDVDNFIKEKQPGKIMDLPGSLKMCKTRDSLIFS